MNALAQLDLIDSIGTALQEWAERWRGDATAEAHHPATSAPATVPKAADLPPLTPRQKEAFTLIQAAEAGLDPESVIQPGGITAYDLAPQLGVGVHAALSLCQRMEEKGWLHRVSDRPFAARWITFIAHFRSQGA